MLTRTKLAAFLATAPMLLPSAGATTLARLSLEQLASASDAVARARCAGVQSRWEANSIWTVLTFDVLETDGGALPAQITVHLPGGRAGHVIATVDGTPKFQPGDEAFLFLERLRAGGYTVAGWVEGTFRISRDPRTHGELVTQDSNSFAVFDVATRTFRSEGIRGMPIHEFRPRLAAAISRTRENSR